MLTSVFAKSLRDRSLTTLVVAGVLLFFVAFSMGIYSGFGDEAYELVEGLPEGILALYGSNDGTAAGMVTGAMFGLMAPLVLLAYAISGGSGAALGEERGKTLDLLLSNPISRPRVILSKAAVLAIGVVTICGLLWLGSELVALAVDLDIANLNLFAASVQLCGLALLFGFLTLAISSWFSGPVGAAIAGTLAGASYLATSLFPIDPNLEPLAKFTPWYLYSGNEPLLNGIDFVGLSIALTITVILLALAVIGFARRDLRG